MVKKIILVICILISVISCVSFYLIDASAYVKLEKIYDTEGDEAVKIAGWDVITEHNKRRLYVVNKINPSDFDFSSYNLVVSRGREIKEMKHRRSSIFPFGYTQYVRTVYSKEWQPNKTYIYKLSKNENITNIDYGYYSYSKDEIEE